MIEARDLTKRYASTLAYGRLAYPMHEVGALLDARAVHGGSMVDFIARSSRQEILVRTPQPELTADSVDYHAELPAGQQPADNRAEA